MILFQKEFNKIENFKTSIRGIKVRGTYDTQKEAAVRAKVLQNMDPSFHVFVGQVGYWLPWDPEANDVADQQYQEEHLNNLVGRREIIITLKKLKILREMKFLIMLNDSHND